MGFAAHRFLTGLPVTAAAIAVCMLVTFAFATRLKRHSVIDVAWGLVFVVVSWTSFAWSSGHGTGPGRLIAVLLCSAWGLRLGSYIGWRQRGHGEDARYEAMLSKAPGSRTAFAIRKIYLTQGIALLFISLPVQVACYEHASFTAVTAVGILLWVIGVFFEAVGDAQLHAFKKDPANKGTVMDRGLWRYTRHPNYFGDTTLWWGLFLVSAAHWPGVLTALSPVAMNYFLTKATGKDLLEKHMAQRPGYKEYQARTSGFFPLPPKKS